MDHEIEFTDAQIRQIWKKLFSTVLPAELSTQSVYEACLMELGSERLREELES